MRIYNKKSFVKSIIRLSVSLLGVASLMIKGLNIKLIILVLILFTWSCITLYFSLSKKTDKVEMSAVDERDRFIIMKCGHMAMRIFSSVSFLVFIVFMIIYGISKAPSFLVVLITLGATMLFLFILLLVLNVYYESNN